jgi:hypothetical protein
MKKLLLLLLFVPIVAFSQKIKIYPLDKVEVAAEKNVLDYEKWLTVQDWYVMRFQLNPVGVKHLFEKFNEIAKLNNIDVEKPYLDKSFLPSYAQDLYNYGNVNTAIQSQDGEIDKTWFVGKSYVKIKLTKDDYQITFHNKE